MMLVFSMLSAPALADGRFNGGHAATKDAFFFIDPVGKKDVYVTSTSRFDGRREVRLPSGECKLHRRGDRVELSCTNRSYVGTWQNVEVPEVGRSISVLVWDGEKPGEVGKKIYDFLRHIIGKQGKAPPASPLGLEI
jgi:hypothetical protein